MRDLSITSSAAALPCPVCAEPGGFHRRGVHSTPIDIGRLGWTPQRTTLTTSEGSFEDDTTPRSQTWETTVYAEGGEGAREHTVHRVTAVEVSPSSAPVEKVRATRPSDEEIARLREQKLRRKAERKAAEDPCEHL